MAFKSGPTISLFTSSDSMELDKGFEGFYDHLLGDPSLYFIVFRSFGSQVDRFVILRVDFVGDFSSFSFFFSSFCSFLSLSISFLTSSLVLSFYGLSKNLSFF